MDLKLILMDHQNSFVGTLKLMSKICCEKYWYSSN